MFVVILWTDLASILALLKCYRSVVKGDAWPHFPTWLAHVAPQGWSRRRVRRVGYLSSCAEIGVIFLAEGSCFKGCWKPSSFVEISFIGLIFIWFLQALQLAPNPASSPSLLFVSAIMGEVLQQFGNVNRGVQDQIIWLSGLFVFSWFCVLFI